MDYNVKKLSDYSDENLIKDIRRVAKILGKDTLTTKEYEKYSKAGITTILRKLGSWNNALKEAGLSVKNVQNVPNEELFAEIERIWNQLGRQPSRDEIDQLCKYSVSTFDNRFGGSRKAIEEFVKWKNQGDDNEFADLNEINPGILPIEPKKTRHTRKVEYGEPIDFLGLRHAPLNEQGVVYLFGILSKQLGFIIEAVRTDFPDCEGKRQIPGKKGRW